RVHTSYSCGGRSCSRSQVSSPGGIGIPWLPGTGCTVTCVVTGRACTMNICLPVIAHSISCGTPKCSSIRSPSRTSCVTCSSVSTNCCCLAVSTPLSLLLLPVGTVTSDCLPTSRCLIRPLVFSTVRVSGVICPATSASPDPHVALITTSSCAPLTGLTVKSTPEVLACTICWTITAMLADRGA